MIFYSERGGMLGTHDVGAAGINWKPCKRQTAHGFFRKSGGKYDKSRVDEDTCRTKAAALAASTPPSPLVLNIEEFNFPNDPAVWRVSYEQLKTALEIYRAELPGHRIGFYRILPEKNFWAPVYERFRDQPGDREKYLEWLRRCRKHRTEYSVTGTHKSWEGLCDLVDIVCPSIYTPYHPSQQSTTKNLHFVETNLKAARLYHKPIIPYMWAAIHDGNAQYGLQYVGDDILREQLTLVKNMEVEGVIWYAGVDDNVNVPASAVQVMSEFFD